MLKHVNASPNYRRANNILFAAIVVINLYVIAAPFWPQLDFWWQTHHTDRKVQLTQAVNGVVPVRSKQSVNFPNTLIIPTIFLNQPTIEGPEKDWANLLKEGVWRWPASSTPDKGGNTVFLAHRFSYTGPRGAFYYLNKLHVGDEIGVVWNNKMYHYSVISSGQVSPTETDIEDNTSDSRITLFTCTPLWHPVDRLVVVAKLEKN